MARRDTGPTQKVRRLVYERDGWVCVFCGSTQITWQHRKGRALGGSKDPAINSVVNGLTLCLGHNLLAEHQPDWARGLGYKVPSWEDPASTAVRYPAGWYLLTEEGGLEPTREPATP